MTFNVVLGRHIGGVTAQSTGSIGSLVYSDIIDSEVVWELKVCPIDHLEVVGLYVSRGQAVNR